MNLSDSLAVVTGFALILLLAYHWRTVSRLKAEVEAQAKTLFEEWSRTVLEAERKRIEETLKRELEEEYRLKLREWIQEKSVRYVRMLLSARYQSFWERLVSI